MRLKDVAEVLRARWTAFVRSVRARGGPSLWRVRRGTRRRFWPTVVADAGQLFEAVPSEKLLEGSRRLLAEARRSGHPEPIT
eukprot:4958660-Alexandrium_andersonii.AAC.1